MRWPFFLKQPAALVEAYRKIDKLTTESAAKDLTIERLQARLDALTPARREDGRFARRGTAADVNPHQCLTTALPTPPETNA